MHLHTSIIHVDWVKDKKFVNDSYAQHFENVEQKFDVIL